MRKIAFDSFAKSHGFDPFVAENWRNWDNESLAKHFRVSKQSYFILLFIICTQAAHFVLRDRKSKTLREALIKAYPNIGLAEVLTFSTRNKLYWDIFNI